jgi:chromatin assembly factor 1 subunit B
MTGPASAFGGPITISLEPGKEDVVDMGLNTPVRGSTVSMVTPRSDVALPSPASSTVDLITPSQTPKKSAADASSMMATAIPDVPRGEGTGATASVFTLPYRMMFAVATQDTVAIHDTQQAGPICLLTKLHYDSFTDIAW